MKNKENNFVSAVLYIRNAEQYIGQFLNSLNGVLSNNFKKYEIVCVDDSSDDKSREIIKEAAENIEGGPLILISTGYYQGLESSMLAGVDFSAGDFVFEFDSVDIDYDRNLILDVYSRCIGGCDIVSASPDKKQFKSSQLFYKVFNKYSRTQYKIQTESFRILSRRAINRINQMSVSIPYRKAIYANCGLSCGNIVFESQHLASKHNDKSPYRRELAMDSFIIFTDIAYKVTLFFALLMMCISAFAGLYTLIVFIRGNPVAGWTTTMLLLAVGLFGIFGVLSIIIKYLLVIVNLIFKKTKYMIGHIEKL